MNSGQHQSLTKKRLKNGRKTLIVEMTSHLYNQNDVAMNDIHKNSSYCTDNRFCKRDIHKLTFKTVWTLFCQSCGIIYSGAR